MTIVTLRVKVPPKRRIEMLELGRFLVDRTQAHRGCMKSGLYQDMCDPDVALLIEEWSSEEALWRHIRSDEYREVLAFIDLSSEFPDIRFNTVSRTAGLEAIRAARYQKTNYEAIIPESNFGFHSEREKLSKEKGGKRGNMKQ